MKVVALKFDVVLTRDQYDVLASFLAEHGLGVDQTKDGLYLFSENYVERKDVDIVVDADIERVANQLKNIEKKTVKKKRGPYKKKKGAKRASERVKKDFKGLTKRVSKNSERAKKAWETRRQRLSKAESNET